jgi:GxxExxY protein
MTIEGQDDETYGIIGAGMEVHSELGSGFLEVPYQEALARELSDRGIPFVREVQLPILYKGRPLDSLYRADFICYGSVIVELKAIKTISPVEEAQLLHYLKATGHERGLLLNFGAPSLQVKRMARSYRP